MGRVRASYCKGAISAMKQHERAEALLDRVIRARAPIRAASNVGFVTADTYVELTDATFEVLPREHVERFWGDRLLDAFGRPLMRPLAYGGLRLFGHHAGSVLRMTPQAYALTYRELGSVSVESSGRCRSAVRILDLPPLFRRPSIVANFSGHAWAALHFAGQAGFVAPDTSRLQSGELVLEVSWNEAAQAG